MNILITVNKSELLLSKVMLTSLLMNNSGLNIVCGYSDLTSKEIETIKILVNSRNSRISFVESNIEDIVIKDRFVIECHKFFEGEDKRAIYISNDTIINDDISNFYHTDFEKNILVARGQTYKYIKGFRKGARPERSQLFDCRVLLICLDELRNKKSEDLILQGRLNFGEFKSFAASINCIFYAKTKIIYDFKYNVRHSIYSREELSQDDIGITPMIISYEKRDYYGIGLKFTPWEFYMSEKDFIKHNDEGKLILEYGQENTYKINIQIMNIWSTYLKCYLENENEEFGFFLNDEIVNKVNELFTNNQTVNALRKKIIEEKSLNSDKKNNIEYSYISRVMDSMDSSDAIRFIKDIQTECINNIKVKKIIKVGFVVHSSSEWQCEMLYRRMELSEIFEPKIIVGYQKQGSQEVYNDLREKTYSFFEKNYSVVKNGDIDNEIEEFDILIYISPYDVYPDSVKIENRTTNQLIIHIPYSYYLVDKDDAIYTEPFYERIIFKISWIICASNSAEIEIAKEKQRLEAYNFEVSGFPKMDEFITDNYFKRNLLQRKGDCITIVWAPHFNMAKGMNGTFNLNYHWFYNYAKKHNDIFWIVRPHPRFASGALEANVFSSLAEVKKYFDEWNKLPNAVVIDDGGYYDIFDASDAMILDSISFLAEYQFTGKPLLFLSPELPRGMNKLGNELLNVIYRSAGDDFGRIEMFIENVKEGKDPKKEDRKKLFDNRLNYFKLNRKLAIDYIWNRISGILGKSANNSF